MTDKEKEIQKQREYENFRMYHQLQYDRMDKLENRREIFNNIVLTISLAIITFGFSKESQINLWTGIGLSIILILANIGAIFFSKRSLEFFKMHQARAKAAREKYAPELNEINKQIGKRDSNKDPFSRTKLYIYIHELTIAVIIVSFCSFVARGDTDSNCCCKHEPIPAINLGDTTKIQNSENNDTTSKSSK